MLIVLQLSLELQCFVFDENQVYATSGFSLVWMPTSVERIC